MKVVSPEVRRHRILGAICIVHSFLVIVLLVALGWMESKWVAAMWITFATLWFVWPFVLILHRGRSTIRVLVPLIVGLIPYSVWGRRYSQIIGVEKFLPPAVDLTPQDLIQYPIGYCRGWTEAKRDIRAGRLIVEPMIGDVDYWPFLKKRYQVHARRLNKGCMINAWMVGHSTAYNRVMLPEIERRFGPGAIAAAIEEDKKDGEEFQEAEARGHADAENDLRNGHLIVEVFGPSDADGANYKTMLHDRYNIELRQLGDAESIRGDSKIIGHANGYNEVSESEIKRKFGDEASRLVMDTKSKFSMVGMPKWVEGEY